MTGANERPVWFGANRSLFGILTEPREHRAGAPAVLLLNAGNLHRVGPNRLYVTLARCLAAAGLPVLRFDYSGLGESAPRQDGVPIKQTVMLEGAEAMDFLAASGVAERFVTMGLCWGGENAHRLAEADARVVGAAIIDGYAYRTAGYHLRHWGRHLASARSWRRLALRVLRAMKQRSSAPRVPFERNPGGVDFVREFPRKERYLAELRRILARGVELCLIFTGGGMSEFYNHERQFAEAFPMLGDHPRVRVTFMPLADHTLTLPSEQRALIAAIVSWAETRFVPRSLFPVAAR